MGAATEFQLKMGLTLDIRITYLILLSPALLKLPKLAWFYDGYFLVYSGFIRGT